MISLLLFFVVGVATTRNSLVLVKDGKLGIANNLGDIVVPVEYTSITSLENDKTEGYIVTNSDNKQGLIGANKKVILETTYDEVKKVYGNEMYVVKDNGKLKIINIILSTSHKEI